MEPGLIKPISCPELVPFDGSFRLAERQTTPPEHAAGKGKKALTAAVGNLGNACGECHKPYRAKKFK